MAWCDVVEPRTLRECRIALGQSQAAFAVMLGASPESYRTWDAGRRATPLTILARARAGTAFLFPVRVSFTRGRLWLDDADNPREEPSAGKPHARICGGEAGDDPEQLLGRRTRQ